MSLAWDSLPLLPLRCILDHLSMEDALAAMSTCRHWRSAFLLYEGKKHTLKLSTGHLQKNVFLTRIFRKHTRNLHIYIANERDLEKFINFILPQFFDTTKLKELIFIGPSYVQKSPRISTVALKRIIIESLIFKHSHCIEKLMFLGCEMGTAKNEHEKHTHKLIEHYSRALSFSKVHSPADAVLSRCNTNLMMFSSLKHILVNYEQLNTQSLETLSNLSNFTQLSFNIIYKRQMNLKPIDWLHLRDLYPNGLDVAVNIISLPHIKFNDVIENVLVERLQLTSLKVMFCKFLYSPILTHVVSLYQNTLREVVWADSPYDASASYQRFLSPVPLEVDMYNMNPFILLCWQCVNLRRLVIHGYWIWQYDLLGFVRLSKRLSDLQVSATYEKQNKFGMCDPLLEGGAVRVLVGDRPESMDLYYQGEVNKCIEFEWKQRPWSKLHPGLRERSTHQQRLDYIVYEASHPLGVT